MKKIKQLLQNNSRWASAKKKEHGTFFKQLAKGQQPDFLWIGCSDSRVPPNTITDLPPGELFVHRNIANVVVSSDLNCLSVIQYAVEALKVPHIVICGHYGCGGVKAALETETHGFIDNWLQHIQQVYRLHRQELDQLSGDEKINRLCELNVQEQVHNLCQTTIVKNAWKKNQQLTVHGLIYSLQQGEIIDLDIQPSGPA